MKLIFLDIDGVVNTENQRKLLIERNGVNDWDYNNIFCKMSLENLKTIIDLTSAKIVLHTSRRYADSLMIPLRYQFMEYGLYDHIIGKTPALDITDTHGTNRESEIIQWLNEANQWIENYVILDDVSEYFNVLKDKLVQTNPRFGISNDIKDEVILRLKRGY